MTQPDLPATFRHMGMTSGLRAAAGRNPGKLAYRHGDKERRYGELVERIDRVSAALTDGLGLKPGSHAAIVARALAVRRRKQCGRTG